ncbi:hypothetical protein BIU88_06710 [Chlorobaculum limnaeum]|uniref:Uncharacterized protein n=1 Tax=Chlorobaculum limnaeum TaxID=274537 RepID=A0A1D8D881_CHLLM|nr:contractile injection system tape measure protein [Chlorobaculum limnaeum]AOS83869.1 hypothetical protein BIU88_06710 [Chlorobaculum limnaeum]
MTTVERHTIGKQFLDIRYNGSATGAMALQSAISGLNRHGIAPRIEQILDRHADSASVLKIDRLEVDAGAVPLEEIESRLPAMIAEALDKALADIAMPEAKISGEAIEESPARRLSEAEAAVDALLFFLRHGTLPATWRPQSHESFEAQLHEAWKRPDLARQTAEALASPTARQRLLAQFSRQIPVTLLETLLPDAMPVIEKILDNFRNAGLPEESTGRIERELIDEALALSTRRTNISTEELQVMLVEIAMSLPEIQASVPDDFRSDESLKNPRSQEKSRTSATDSAEGETARVTRDSAPPAHRESDETPLSGQSESDLAHSDNHPPNMSSETAAQDGQSTPSGNQRSDRSVGVTERSPDSFSVSRDANTGNRTTGNSSPEQTNEPWAHGASGDRPATTSQASFSGSGSDSTAKHQDSGHQRTPFRHTAEPVPEHPDERRGLYVENAGLVLLHPFLPQMFEALGIAGDDELLRPGEALRLLHYLATGDETAPEYELALPKILCGLPPASLAGEAGPFTDEEREESAALLSAVIRHWEALKNTSPDGLREAFLKRPGKLTRWHDGGWLLQVESNSFDILLDRLPWGFSMIRLPWMPSMLHVEWRF